MTQYESFSPSGLPFRDRIGDPCEFDAALGQITINFQELKATLSEAIESLLNTNDDTTATVTAELSFKGQVNLLAALTRGAPAAEPPERLRQLERLMNLCFQAETLRNRYMQSWWPGNTQDGQTACRRKRTAMSGGYREQREQVSSSQLLDIADYLAYASTMVEEFYGLDFCVADSR